MIDIALHLSFIDVESSFDPKAFLMDRNGGSYGLNQLDLPTARDRGYKGDGPGLMDPYLNWKYGILDREWIAAQLRKDGNYSIEALAMAYNEGLQGERDARPDPQYVNKIVAAYARWKILFPPDPAATG